MADLSKRDFIPMNEEQTTFDIAADTLTMQRYGKNINTLDEWFYSLAYVAMIALAATP